LRAATLGWTFPTSLPRLRAVLALLVRDYQIRTSYRLALVLGLFFGVLDLLLYYFISKTFEGATTAPLQGAPSYFAFALVGIAITVVIQAATTGQALRVRDEQLTGTLEALMAQPLSPTELATGLCGLPFLLATVRIAIYLIVAGVLLGLDFPHASWLGFVVVLLATGFAMSCIGVASGAIVLLIKRGQSLTGVIILGMSLLGGAFFPVSVLPDWLEVVGKIVPTRFAFDGLRSALYTGGGWTDDALILGAFSLVFLPVALWMFKQALLLTRRSGSLTQY
jgi:ABC-2 type transport system permease protein